MRSLTSPMAGAFILRGGDMNDHCRGGAASLLLVFFAGCSGCPKVSGPANVPDNSTYIYATTRSAPWVWSVTSPGTIVAGQGTAFATIDWGTGPGQATVSVNGTHWWNISDDMTVNVVNVAISGTS